MMNKGLLILNLCFCLCLFSNIIDTRGLYPIIINLLILLGKSRSLNFFIHILIFSLHGTFVYFKYTITLKRYH